MTITLTLSLEQEMRLWAAVARGDSRFVREILIQVIDATVEELLQSPARTTGADTLSKLLDKIATEFRDAPVLSDEALSRTGIYSG